MYWDGQVEPLSISRVRARARLMIDESVDVHVNVSKTVGLVAASVAPGEILWIHNWIW